MRDELVEKVVSNAKYQKLKSTRSSFGWILTAIMLIAYYGYIVIIAFDKEMLSARLGEGVMTVGIPVGIGLIIFTVVITGLYVRRANTEFDEMTEEILREVK